MVNRVILIGNLGKDPEVRTLESGAKVAKFSIATNENYKDREGNWQTVTEWHDVVAWRIQAEKAEQTLKKGFPVYVEGKLTTRTYQDQDGNNRRITEVVAQYIRSLARKEDGGGYSSNMPDSSDEPPFTNTNTGDSKEPAVMEESADDDLPF